MRKEPKKKKTKIVTSQEGKEKDKKIKKKFKKKNKKIGSISLKSVSSLVQGPC